MRRRRAIADYMSAAPFTIEHTQSLAEAIEVMRAKGVRHLPVLEQGKLVGILSERDVYWCEAQKDVDPEVLSVGEAMTPEPCVVEPHEALAAVAQRMAEGNFGSALVVDHGKLQGVFTTSDGLRVLAQLLRRLDGVDR